MRLLLIKDNNHQIILKVIKENYCTKLFWKTYIQSSDPTNLDGWHYDNYPVCLAHRKNAWQKCCDGLQAKKLHSCHSLYLGTFFFEIQQYENDMK